MLDQVRAIFWAQIRAFRNVLPRTSWGTVLTWLVSPLWYGIFAGAGMALAVTLPQLSVAKLHGVVPPALLGVLLFWQIFPLMTLSSGRSLDVRKLLVFPIRRRTIFLIEVLLSTTAAPEMFLVLGGLLAGLLKHPLVPFWSPALLVFYAGWNLVLLLGIRNLAARAVDRKILRGLFFAFCVTASVTPSLLMNTPLGRHLQPVFFAVAYRAFAPWQTAATLAMGQISADAVAASLLWFAAALLFSSWQLALALRTDQHTFRGVERRRPAQRRAASLRLNAFAFIRWIFRDPLAALIEKELHVLSRSPRFRVIFGMACFFSLVVFIPFHTGQLATAFMSNNYLPVVNAYGLIIVGEVLLWNAFGFDRKAAQFYFVAPVPIVTVLRAKNIVAFGAIWLMSALIIGLAMLFRVRVTAGSIAGSLLLTSVLGLFFLAFGNLTSVIMPRPIDPNQAFRKQASAKASVWLLLSVVVLLIPVALAFAAQWAFNSQWALFMVLLVDLLVAIVTYSVATESAVARAGQNREKLLTVLSETGDPVG